VLIPCVHALAIPRTPKPHPARWGHHPDQSPER
jgi:hypothetical protein